MWVAITCTSHMLLKMQGITKFPQNIAIYSKLHVTDMMVDILQKSQPTPILLCCNK